MIDQLEVLEPTGAQVQFRGERLEVRPLTLDKLASIVRAARPVISALIELEDQVADADDSASLNLLLDLIETHSDGVGKVIAIAIGRDHADVAAAELPEFMDLAQTVIEVNRDFFGQLLASLQGGRAARLTTGAGRTPSSSSSSAGTD